MVTGLILTVLATLTPAAAYDHRPVVEVRFREEVTLDGPDIRLGDVAEIQTVWTPWKQRLESLVVGQCTLPGYSRTLSIPRIISAYLDPLRDSCKFRTERGGDIKIYTRAQLITRPEIEKLASDHIYAIMPWNVQDVVLTFKSTPASIPLPVGAWKAVVRTADGFTSKGSQHLYLDIRQGDNVIHSVNLAVEIRVSGYVCVARNKLKRGSILAAEDVELAYQDLTRFRYRPYGKLEQVVGKRLARTVSEGTVLHAGLADEPPLVKNGEEVQVKSRSGATEVTAPAVALHEARAGGLIRVKNRATHKVLEGTLGEDKTVYLGRW